MWIQILEKHYAFGLQMKTEKTKIFMRDYVLYLQFITLFKHKYGRTINIFKHMVQI